ncbi:MAG: PorV/PorQ family protein [Elusimicrobia bacterium]|nr:PorV/PorQ family protein [Elusimicrobiota bacterium]
MNDAHRRSGRSARRLAAIALFLALAQKAGAEPGVTGLNTLKRSFSAHGAGLADAYSGVSGGLQSLGYNPAGLCAARAPEIGTSYTHGLADDHFSAATYAQPAGPGIAAAGLAYYDAGSIQLNLSDGTNEKRKAQQDWVGMAAYGIELGYGLAIGGAGKFFRSTLAEEASATGQAFDIGGLWASPVRGLLLGGSIQNIGPKVKYESEGDPLPMTSRTGASYSRRFHGLEELGFGFSRFQASTDAIKLREERWAFASAVEMSMPLFEQGLVALRLGYIFNRDSDNLTVGLGLSDRRFKFDYALRLKQSLNQVHQFSFGIRL